MVMHMLEPMATYQTLHQDVVDVNRELLSLFGQAKSIPETPEDSFDDWEKTCRSIETQVSEEILRVAVVGAIKSGKSTFANSLLSGDYLKRGAGVVTSIVTRVRHGRKLQAHLHFKSWDEINADIEQALVLLPTEEWRSGNDRFDIRDERDRADLEAALRSLGPDALHADGFRNANSVLLSSYLKGFEKVASIVSSETHIHRFDGKQFPDYLAFVGEDARAVYLHDVHLNINTGDIGPDMEIADCQGSDSPNPHHLAMIQDYLLFTHLIVYVISSRTGLRQADIRFLSIIKKMGLLESILFIVNCDFGEHESLEDLENLVAKVEEEISLIKPAPDIYAFSSLYNLLKAKKDRLTARDEMRMAQWESDREAIGYSDRSTDRFLSDFHQKLTGERNSLLVNNHIERLGILASGLNHWAQVNRDILVGDSDSGHEIVGKIQLHQQKMDQIGAVIRSTLDGAVHQIKEELKADIERFFSMGTGSVFGGMLAFIRSYDGLSRRYEESIGDSGFSSTLYLAYQDFKQAVDRFIAEEVNPALIRFVRDKEDGIGSHLQSVAAQYDVIIRDTLTEYDRAMGSYGMSRIQDASRSMVFGDIESIRSGEGLDLPISVAAMRYSTSIKTSATIRLGLYNTLKFVKRIFRRTVGEGHAEEMHALKDGIVRMKQETEGSITSHFTDQKENIKFQYFFRLADAVAGNYHQMLLDRFQIYTRNLTQLSEKIDADATDTDRAGRLLGDIIQASVQISDRIAGIRDTLREG